MPIHTLISLIIVIVPSAFLYIKAFPIFCAVEGFCNQLLTPLDRLCGLFSSSDSFLEDNKVIRVIVMLGVFFASVGYIVTSLLGGVDYVELIKSFFSGNALMGLAELMVMGFGPKEGNTFALFISIGISSFLSFLYMRCTVETLEETRLPKVIKLLLVAVFNILFTFISFFISETVVLWCSNATAYTIRIYQQLAAFFASGRHPLGQVLKLIPTALVFLVLLYAAFNALVVTFREALATVMYGLFAIGLLMIFMPVFMIPNFPTAVTSLIGTICLIIPDYIRANADAKERFIRFITRS